MISIKESSELLGAEIEDIIYDDLGRIIKIVFIKDNSMCFIESIDEDGTARDLRVRVS